MWCPAMTVESPLCQFPVSATYTVMAGLVPAIHVSFGRASQDVDGRPAPAMTMGQAEVSSRAGRPTAGVELTMTDHP